MGVHCLDLIPRLAVPAPARPGIQLIRPDDARGFVYGHSSGAMSNWIRALIYFGLLRRHRAGECLAFICATIRDATMIF